MQTFDSTYWTQRYLNDQATWDAGTITQPLKEYIDQLKDKSISILIPGAGNAYEAEYLHHNGFTNVFVADISPEPLANIRRRDPSFPDNNLLLADFFKMSGQYDLILEQTFFCALHPSQRSAYAKKMHELLKPGAALVGLLFSGELNKDSPPFGGSKEEYLQYFSPFFQIRVLKPCYNSIKPRAGRELFMNLRRK